MKKSINERVFDLHDEGFKAGKIAQKLKVKKSVVMDILGEAGKSEGLGDVVTKFTEVTGIKAVVEAITDDCGCKARAEKLNKLFPNRKLSDLSDSDYNYLEMFFREGKPTSVSAQIQKDLVGIYNRVFNSKRVPSSCSPCVAGIVKDLKKIYDESNK